MHYEWEMGNGEASRCGVGGRGERAKKSAAHQDDSGFQLGGEGVVGTGVPRGVGLVDRSRSSEAGKGFISLSILGCVDRA